MNDLPQNAERVLELLESLDSGLDMAVATAHLAAIVAAVPVDMQNTLYYEIHELIDRALQHKIGFEPKCKYLDEGKNVFPIGDLAH